MTLSEFVAKTKREIFAELQAGKIPSIGEFDARRIEDGRKLGPVQIGSASFSPSEIQLEFLYSDGKGNTVILTVKLASPERIVFLPVPEWVVESIWQGDIDGSFHFETQAQQLLQKFLLLIEPENNIGLFGPKQATRRE